MGTKSRSSVTRSGDRCAWCSARSRPFSESPFPEIGHKLHELVGVEHTAHHVLFAGLVPTLQEHDIYALARQLKGRCGTSRAGAHDDAVMNVVFHLVPFFLTQ